MSSDLHANGGNISRYIVIAGLATLQGDPGSRLPGCDRHTHVIPPLHISSIGALVYAVAGDVFGSATRKGDDDPGASAGPAALCCAFLQRPRYLTPGK